MKLIETRILRGPNVYADFPCFLAVVEDPAFAGAARGLPDLLAAMLGQLQQAAGTPVGFCEARPVPGHAGRYAIVAAYELEKVVTEAFRAALAVLRGLREGRRPAMAAELERLQALVARHALGPSTAAVVAAARRRDIPVFRVTEDASLFQLGWGKQQKRIQATLTSNTSHVATELAQDKDLTKLLLAEAGLPVPRGEVVRSEDEAVRVARRLGPVAIKPLDGNQGKGVSVGVAEEAAVREAFRRARQHGRAILVEQAIPGDDYRVLVVGGEVVAAARRRPAQVRGDGTHSVAELVALENRNPLRGEGHSKPMTRLSIDDEVLARQGLKPDDVPAEDQVVVLKENANLSTGGTAEDVTALVHPQVAEACRRAARKIGLDVAGIDLVCQDIAQPLAAQRGAIIEVNAAPGIRMHQHPSLGEPHDVGAAIVDSLFPPGTPARVPVIAVTGTNGKTTTALLMGHVLQHAGLVTGVTTTEAIYIDGRPVSTGDCTGYWSARTVLTDPAVEAAVLEVARGGIFKRGLAFDRSDVGVVLNVGDDHLGQHGAHTLEDLARVKGLIVRTARRGVVLNAEDPLVAAMAADRLPGAELVYFALDPANPVLQAHLDQGGRAVFLRRDMVMLAHGDHQLPLVPVQRLPFTLEGRARFNVANALAAVGALWLIGHPTQQIAAGLETFTSSPEQNPGRLNFFRIRDFQVIADYAHNPASYEALAQMARQLPHARLIGVLTAPGDRPDQTLLEVGRACGRGFDELVIRDIANDLRGRAPGATPALIARGAREAGMEASRIRVILDEAAAVEAALADARAGDLVVVGRADTPRLLAQLAAHANGPQITITRFEAGSPSALTGTSLTGGGGG